MSNQPENQKFASFPTLVLYFILILDESELPFLQAIDLWKSVSHWLKFTAYLATTFFFIKAIDLLVVEDFLIAKKGFYIPDLLRLMFGIAGLALAGLVFLRTVMGINVIALQKCMRSSIIPTTSCFSRTF